jgi:hypothetical protein
VWDPIDECCRDGDGDMELLLNLNFQGYLGFDSSEQRHPAIMRLRAISVIGVDIDAVFVLGQTVNLNRRSHGPD